MRIAFTGSSSTGKTTLARALSEDPQFTSIVPQFFDSTRYVTPREFGYEQADEMPGNIRREWRMKYFEQKKRAEQWRDGFITDRSFVDIAAYWMVFDCADDQSRRNAMELSCRELAERYDMHFYFPTGLVPRERGGRRSQDERLHRGIDLQILDLLRQWKLPFISLSDPRLDERVRSVRAWTRAEIGRA